MEKFLSGKWSWPLAHFAALAALSVVLVLSGSAFAGDSRQALQQDAILGVLKFVGYVIAFLFILGTAREMYEGNFVEAAALLVVALSIGCSFGFAEVGNLPGKDESSKLEAAGTLLRIVDVVVFRWGGRIAAALCLLSGAWSLKQQQFGLAAICIFAAIVIGTAPTWVKNIFSIGGDSSIFGQSSVPSQTYMVGSSEAGEKTHGSV